MLTLVSWNVNGIRAAQRKGFLDWLHSAQPDILGLQETKATTQQLDEALLRPAGYHTFWSSAERKGYSGVALYTRTLPRAVRLGIGINEFDSEGRTIIAEYDDFTFITSYVPNGGSELARVPFKMRYSDALLAVCDDLRAQGKSVILCGDINTAHQAIDLARPKENRTQTGFLPEECAWMDKLFNDHGYIDTFRRMYPEQPGAYSWWAARGGARERNIGWRLDYFIISPDLWPRVTAAAIHPAVLGSDHCPVSLTLGKR